MPAVKIRYFRDLRRFLKELAIDQNVFILDLQGFIRQPDDAFNKTFFMVFVLGVLKNNDVTSLRFRIFINC